MDQEIPKLVQKRLFRVSKNPYCRACLMGKQQFCLRKGLHLCFEKSEQLRCRYG